MVGCVERWRARLVAVVAVIAAFVLAGCKINGRVDLRADGGTKLDFTLEDADGMMAKIHQTCEGVRLILEGAATFINDPKVEDITPPGGHLKCKFTSNKPLKGKGMGLSKKSNKYYFRYLGAHDDYEDLSDLRTKIVITMPGRVVKSSLGSVEGRQVFIENLDFLTYGLSIEADAGGSSASSSAKGGSVVSSSGGVSVWVWAGVVGGVLVVVGGVVALRRRKRRVVPVSRDLGPAGFGPTAGLGGSPGPGAYVPAETWPGSGQGGVGQVDTGMKEQDPHSRYRPR